MGIIRILLALSVLAAHSEAIFGTNLVGGKIAVQAFYIISGFYMSLILNEKYIGKNNSFRLFITNRFIRLFPIYWIVLTSTIIVCIGVVIITKGQILPKFDSYLSVKTNILSFLFLILTNIFLFGQDIVMFLGITPENGNLFFISDFAITKPPLHSFLFVPQAWTLSIELMFYLIAPFILKRGFKFVIIIIILSFICRLYLFNNLGLQNDPWTYRFFPSEIMFFLFGYLSYRMYLKIKNIFLPTYISKIILLYVIVLTIVYQSLPVIKISYSPFNLFEIIYFLSIIFSIPVLFNFSKNLKFDNMIGELSYPVYISHILVITICSAVPFEFLKTGWLFALITIIIAYFLNKIVAIPLEKYRQSRLNNIPNT